MNIKGVYYNTTTSIDEVSTLKYIFNTKIYHDPIKMNEIIKLISSFIESLIINYEPTSNSIHIKIKKTSMKKINGFTHTPMFYYNIMYQVFSTFLAYHKAEIIEALKERYPDPYAVYNRFLQDPWILSGLCNVSCISDNILIITL